MAVARVFEAQRVPVLSKKPGSTSERSSAVLPAKIRRDEPGRRRRARLLAQHGDSSVGGGCERLKFFEELQAHHAVADNNVFQVESLHVLAPAGTLGYPLASAPGDERRRHHGPCERGSKSGWNNEVADARAPLPLGSRRRWRRQYRPRRHCQRAGLLSRYVARRFSRKTRFEGQKPTLLRCSKPRIGA